MTICWQSTRLDHISQSCPFCCFSVCFCFCFFVFSLLDSTLLYAWADWPPFWFSHTQEEELKRICCVRLDLYDTDSFYRIFLGFIFLFVFLFFSQRSLIKIPTKELKGEEETKKQIDSIDLFFFSSSYSKDDNIFVSCFLFLFFFLFQFPKLSRGRWIMANNWKKQNKTKK